MSEQNEQDEPLTNVEKTAFDEMMAQPVTRTEMLRVLSTLSLSLTSHSMAETAIANGDQTAILDAIKTTLEINQRVVKIMRDFMKDWTRELPR